MEIKFLAFLAGAIQFSKFHGNETKYDKRNIKRGLIVPLEVKSL